MKGKEIVDFFKKYPDINSHFLGVIFLDDLPSNIPHESYYIVNIGEHWITFGCLNATPLIYECFDSLSMNSNYLQENFCFHGTCFFNKSQLQPDDSNLCGLYAIYFLYHRITNFDLSLLDLLETIFDTDPAKNEKIVKQFFNEFY